MIKRVSLNDNWLFHTGFGAECLEPDFDFSQFFVVGLPHGIATTQESYFSEEDCRGVATYSRVLVVPEEYNGRRLVLQFAGVLHYAEVYVNGVFVASHKGDTPFEADITAPVRYDYENRIVVKADSSIRRQIPCAGVKGDEICYGGIYRDVFLAVLDGREIRDVFVRTEDVLKPEKGILLNVTLYDYYPETTVEGEVCGPDGKTVCYIAGRSVHGADVLLKGRIETAELWDPEKPTLYTAVVRLRQGGKLLDLRTVRFGFRTAEFRRDGFYLNGRLCKLAGLNRTDSWPHVGRAMPEFQQRADARLLKQLGVNAVRCLGLPSSYFVDECNRIGLMIVEDLGGDGYVGTGEWRDVLLGKIADTVRRDRNDPSVIAWGVRVNHSRDCDELYFKATKTAHDLDPTRAVLGVRDCMLSRLYEDVFGFNDYARVGVFSKRKHTSKLFVPYLISEHTGKSFPCKSYDSEAVRLEHAMCHLEALDRLQRFGGLAGAFGMSVSDFNAPSGLGSGDNVNYYGVTDSNRCPKFAAYAYASQRDDDPVLELSSDLSRDEFCGVLCIFTNCDSVRLYRGDALVGEYKPDRKRFSGVKHPPVMISDFIGVLPESEGIGGLRLKLFKSVCMRAQRFGTATLYGWNRPKVWLLKKLLGMDDDGLAECIDRYGLWTPGRPPFRFEGIRDGATVISRTLSVTKRITVEAEVDRTQVWYDKAYETARVSVTARDENGNVLSYAFVPVTVSVGGNLALIGNSQICLKGGRAAFYVKNIASGAGKITIRTPFGEKTLDLEADYAAVEGL